MSAKIDLLPMNSPHVLDDKQNFIHDVAVGFSKVHKEISPKYFYDERGSEIFNQITHHPDYYLTGSELAILDFYKKDLAELVKNDDLNLVELGPGEGIKTRLLLDQFLHDKLSFKYYSIDISQKYLIQLVDKFKEELPLLETIPLNYDYLDGVKWLGEHSEKRNFLLFLGSSIGNFNAKETKRFLKILHDFLHPGDYVLIGFDLLKEIDILWRAYNDEAGLTREFNLNLLRRMNKELGANSDVDSFFHYGTFNVYSKAMESYLVSYKAQNVTFEALNKSFHFKEFETIHTESSQKYSLSDIENLARASKFKIINNFTDTNHLFVNSLWQVQDALN